MDGVTRLANPAITKSDDADTRDGGKHLAPHPRNRKNLRVSRCAGCIGTVTLPHVIMIAKPVMSALLGGKHALKSRESGDALN